MHDRGTMGRAMITRILLDDSKEDLKKVRSRLAVVKKWVHLMIIYLSNFSLGGGKIKVRTGNH